MKARALLGRVHFWLSILVGVQMLIWVGSGFFFAISPIERVRGEHLRAHEHASIAWESVKIGPDIAAAALDGRAAHSVTLATRAGRPVYAVEAHEGPGVLVDAETGAARTEIDAAEAQSIAIATFTGTGAPLPAEWITTPPGDYGGPLPAWRVRFSGPDQASLYIEAATGDVRAVRTPLWRLYDFLWGFHIMDWQGRENFNNPFLMIFAATGLGMALSGLILTVMRASNSWKRRAA
jgi:hypothetical protein